MSGNPFRKQTAAEAPKSKGKTKKVTFVSPIASPQEEQPSHPRFPALEELDDVPKSPPPRGLTEEPEAIDTRALLRGDITAGGTIDLKANEREEAVAAARQTASHFQLGQPPAGRTGPPANPFARTLASMEAEASAGKLNYDASKQKQVMDVDSFKRMLLTGTSEAPPTGGPNTGNSTDSSYASKLSGSEQDREARPGSPAFSISSLEDASSEEESDSETEPVNTGATAEVKTDSTQIQQGPQTVSFDNFDDEALQPSRMDAELPTPASPRAVEKKPTLPPPPPTSRRPGQARRLTLNTDVEDSDMAGSSRPKPPPPRAPGSRQVSRDVRTSSDSTRTVSSDTVPTIDDTDTKAKPPPPPSRKQVRRMSSSGSGVAVAPRRASPAGVAGSTPPPPPPRRGETKRPSLEGARPTGDTHSIGTDRRSSIGSLERTVEEEGESADMLADLDAFQKEVDALRAKALKGA